LPNNYRPISKLPALAKVLESLVSEQVKEYLNAQSILSKHQSGFRKKHSTTTAALKVINDIVKALDDKKHCVSLFIDLSKAFDHSILVQRLISIGISHHSVGWFINHLTDRTQATQVDGLTSKYLSICKGVPFWGHFIHYL